MTPVISNFSNLLNFGIAASIACIEVCGIWMGVCRVRWVSLDKLSQILTKLFSVDKDIPFSDAPKCNLRKFSN